MTKHDKSRNFFFLIAKEISMDEEMKDENAGYHD